jgi:hypothetical protein
MMMAMMMMMVMMMVMMMMMMMMMMQKRTIIRHATINGEVSGAPTPLVTQTKHNTTGITGTFMQHQQDVQGHACSITMANSPNARSRSAMEPPYLSCCCWCCVCVFDKPNRSINSKEKGYSKRYMKLSINAQHA